MYSQTLHKVKNMVSDRNATNLAQQFGLCIQNVSWEDCARQKHSTWGPCISDMTLQVDKQALPVVRLPHFQDVSWDQSLKQIPLNVGNQVGAPLHTTSLYEYLEHFSEYLHSPPSQSINLIAPERDQNAIMTAQACFLPIQEGHETKFNVCIRNYQSSPGNPAVLVIVASSSGTSAQVIDQSNIQTLYFNNDGQKASFTAKRLKDQRIEQGRPISGPMTAEEKADNMIVIVQVPLIQRAPPSFPEPIYQPYHPYPGPYPGVYPMPYPMEPCLDDINECHTFAAAAPMVENSMHKQNRARKPNLNQHCDVDQAMISVGADEGPFNELRSASIVRDHRYPIRVTLQYYKATSNGIVNANVLEEIAIQIATARSFTSHDKVGSLVDSHSNRTTETQPQNRIPDWWSRFWHAYHMNFPHLSEAEAKRRVFTPGNPFSSRSLDQAETQLLMFLSSGSYAATSSKPTWDPTVPFGM